jgi:hypothetical protein
MHTTVLGSMIDYFLPTILLLQSAVHYEYSRESASVPGMLSLTEHVTRL